VQFTILLRRASVQECGVRGGPYRPHGSKLLWPMLCGTQANSAIAGRVRITFSRNRQCHEIDPLSAAREVKLLPMYRLTQLYASFPLGRTHMH